MKGLSLRWDSWGFLKVHSLCRPFGTEWVLSLVSLRYATLLFDSDRRQSNALTSLVGQAKQGFVPRDFRDTSKLYVVSEEIGFFGNQGMSLGTYVRCAARRHRLSIQFCALVLRREYNFSAWPGRHLERYNTQTVWLLRDIDWRFLKR